MERRTVTLKDKHTNEKVISNTKRQELKKMLLSFTKQQLIQHLDPTHVLLTKLG